MLADTTSVATVVEAAYCVCVIKKSFLLLDMAVLNLAATLLVTVTVTFCAPLLAARVLLAVGTAVIITLA